MSRSVFREPRPGPIAQQRSPRDLFGLEPFELFRTSIVFNVSEEDSTTRDAQVVEPVRFPMRTEGRPPVAVLAYPSASILKKTAVSRTRTDEPASPFPAWEPNQTRSKSTRIILPMLSFIPMRTRLLF